jgi:hypothetical protein
LHIRSEAAKGEDSEQNAEEYRDDVTGAVRPVVGVIPEALIDPDGTETESIRVSTIH